MKLIENIERLGNSMETAIKNMVDEMFGRELSNEQVGDIVNGLKLSDILVLDSAYTAGDKEKVAQILGVGELSEYSMGRNATSAAAERPKPGRREAPQSAASDTTDKNTTQTNRSYSGGAQNAVTTKKVNDDDPDTVMQDSESIEEDSNSDKSHFAAVARQLGVLMGNKGRLIDYTQLKYGRDMKLQVGDHEIRLRHNWKRDGSSRKPITIITIDDETINLGRFSIWKGNPKDYAEDLHNAIEQATSMDENVIDMVEWLQRKAGIK